jgi:hypothetical protein
VIHNNPGFWAGISRSLFVGLASEMQLHRVRLLIAMLSSEMQRKVNSRSGIRLTKSWLHLVTKEAEREDLNKT